MTALARPATGTGAAAPGCGRWRRVVAGQSVSLSGAYAQQVALGYLALRAAGPVGVAAVTACRYLPALAAPHVGRWADARSRRRLLRRTSVAQAVLAAVFAVVCAAAGGTAPALWVLCLFAAAYAPGATLDAVCATPVLVDRAGGRAREAVARMSVGTSLARVVGALVAGALVAVGPSWLFAFNALSFLALFAALAPDPCDHDGARAVPSSPDDLPGRWWRSDGLWPVAAGFVVFAAAAYQPAVLWPTLGDRLLGGAAGVAQLTAAAAVGTLAGGLLAVRSPSRGWRPAAAGYIVCAAGLGVLAAGRPGDRPAAWAGAVLFGTGAAWALAKVAGTFAASLDPRLRSRAQGWYRLLLDGTGPAGGLAVGVVCAAWGPSGGAWACAGLAVLAAAVSAATARWPGGAVPRRRYVPGGARDGAVGGQMDATGTTTGAGGELARTAAAAAAKARALAAEAARWHALLRALDGAAQHPSSGQAAGTVLAVRAELDDALRTLAAAAAPPTAGDRYPWRGGTGEARPGRDPRGPLGW